MSREPVNVKDSPRRGLRVGAVSYLNSKPLIYRLQDVAPHLQLVLDVPSRLADRLARNELDVALVPSIVCLDEPDFQIVSDACIACRGPVLSVKLLSYVPIDAIRSVALDEGSRTSVVLLQILLWRRLGRLPALCSLPIDSQLDAVDCDAVLVIGDRAIHAARGVFRAEWDLGEEWYRDMGVPFVFAMWAARTGVETGDLADVLGRVRDAGVAHVEQIAALSAPQVGLAPAACLAYLRDNLHFQFGPQERQGLDSFAGLVAELRGRVHRHGSCAGGLSVA